MAKQDNTNTEEEVAMEVMPGADPLTEEEQGEEGDKVAGEKFKAEFLKTLADNKSKNPDRAQIEVDGPLSTDTPKKEEDTSQPKEVDVKAVSPYQTKNNISFPNHPKKG